MEEKQKTKKEVEEFFSKNMIADDINDKANKLLPASPLEGRRYAESFIFVFFTDRKRYNEYSNKLKEDNFYYLCDILAKKYPIEISEIHHLHHWSTVDRLHKQFYTGRYPDFIRSGNATSMSKTDAKKYNDKVAVYKNYSDEVLVHFLDIFDYEMNSVISLCKMFPLEAKQLFEEAKIDLAKLNAKGNASIMKLSRVSNKSVKTETKVKTKPKPISKFREHK